MKYVSPTGDIYLFDPKHFYPLNCAQFVEAHKSKTSLYPINVLATEINITSPSAPPRYYPEGEIEMQINFHHLLPVYALVDNGWLPPPFVMPPQLLLDRNVIGSFQQISKGHTVSYFADYQWWMRLIKSEKFTFNPLLYALEADRQSIPDLSLIKQSFAEATSIIKVFAPEARVIEFNEIHFQAAFTELSGVVKNHESETLFLQEAAPLIKENVATQKLPEIEGKIIELAKKHGLLLMSLPVLAVLSCLYEDRNISGFNAARELLKLKKGHYTPEKAYNALSDLRGLMFYLAFRAIADSSQMPPFAFCTSDKAVLLFGCGLNFKKVEFRGSTLTLKAELSEFLFPRLSEEGRSELVNRLETE